MIQMSLEGRERANGHMFVNKERNKIKVINISKFNSFFIVLPMKPIETTMCKLGLTLKMSFLCFKSQNALTLTRKKGVL